MSINSISQILNNISKDLEENSSSPRLDAELLVMHSLGWSRTQLFINSQKSLLADQFENLSQLFERRKRGEPIAYILGEQEFWSLPLCVTEDTLIPRPETEHLVEIALSKIPQNVAWDIADLGTGSGAIALAIAHERKNCRVMGVDFSSAALEVATLNANKLDIKNVSFIQSSWLNELDQKLFHLIVSNPPYVEEGDEHLLQGDVAFEPRSALVSGADGLDDIRQISHSASKHLYSKGWLMLEHGWNQAEQVQNILLENQFQQISTINDLADIPRITIGCKL